MSEPSGTQLVLATNNSGKVQELAALLRDFGFEVRGQSEFGVPEVAESGTTFVENAIIKARAAAQHTHLPAIADDSGIEVDALHGAPGVYSARFAGADTDDAQNNAKLVESLRDVPTEERTARYRAVIVYMRHAEDPAPLIAEGVWEGVIQLEPKGSNGFGYDPHFYLPDLGCTSAELEPAEKSRLSHRGQALRALLGKLRETA
ncbi:MAG: RdgB/HAM1 family non-canonical purine NTP pyrophosphatase [Gammaproteobacteria bacterium]|nr:RdgB/HAM1 family non-canonical purine NTP pyrophosphatase [Gammaproteobacteria bacterium]